MGLLEMGLLGNACWERRRLVRGVWLAGGCVAAVLALAELAHRQAARAQPDPVVAGPGLAGPGASGRESGGPEAGSEAIIVLGYPPRRGNRVHPLARWRVQIAARSMGAGRSSTLIMTGGAKAGADSEAAVMGRYARDVLGVPAESIALEEQARSTRQNMAYSLPLAEGSAVIKIASDPLHARRARRYLAELRPDLLARLEPAATYRPGEYPVLKAATLAYESAQMVRHRLLAARRPLASPPVRRRPGPAGSRPRQCPS
jgi:uncharacterized SAM-binding protein YcdF (DUF218 family)